MLMPQNAYNNGHSVHSVTYMRRGALILLNFNKRKKKNSEIRVSDALADYERLRTGRGGWKTVFTKRFSTSIKPCCKLDPLETAGGDSFSPAEVMALWAFR